MMTTEKRYIIYSNNFIITLKDNFIKMVTHKRRVIYSDNFIISLTSSQRTYRISDVRKDVQNSFFFLPEILYKVLYFFLLIKEMLLLYRSKIFIYKHLCIKIKNFVCNTHRQEVKWLFLKLWLQRIGVLHIAK